MNFCGLTRLRGRPLLEVGPAPLARRNGVKMGKKSKEKGKLGEREVANLFKKEGFEAKRGVQYQGGTDSPDVKVDTNIPLHIEVKRCETFRLEAAIKQAKDDAEYYQLPIVFHRKNGTKWAVVMESDCFFELLKLAEQEQIRRGNCGES